MKISWKIGLNGETLTLSGRGIVVGIALLTCSLCAADDSSSQLLPGTSVAGTNSTRALPSLPGTTTPADTFRELLSMTPAQRAEALASRSEPQRLELESRLAEYLAMSPSDREARLEQLTLRCHLVVLMKLPPAQRAQRLEVIPPLLRPIIDERLRQWDSLTPKMQKEVMDYETTSSYFFRVKPEEGQAQKSASKGLAPLPGVWKGRGGMAHGLSQFLSLPVKERGKALESFPISERDEIERTLKAFDQLPLEQRQSCLQSFEKFSRMSKEQRDQFFKNAERWKTMTARERTTWASLVQIVPPASSSIESSSIGGGQTSIQSPASLPTPRGQ